jgi:hypothetical protein
MRYIMFGRWKFMFKKSIAMILLVLTVITLATSANGLPDLTVTSVATGTPSFISPSEANLPLTVTIRNAGDSTSTSV